MPRAWIGEIGERLRAYVDLAGARDADALRAVGVALVERHGPPPAPASRLLDVHRLRLRCEALGIAALRIDAEGARIDFAPVTSVDRPALAERLAVDAGTLSMDGAGTLSVTRGFEDLDDGLAFVDALLDDIGGRARRG